MTIESGVDKTLAYKKETTWGVAAGASGAAYLPRTTAEINLTRNTFRSAEIRTDAQTVDSRLGTIMVAGTINDELSCTTHQDLYAAFLREAWVAGSTTGALTTLGVTATNQFTRSSGSFVTDGFKVGDLVLSSGYTTPANNGYFIVTGVASGVLTVDASTLVTEAAGATVTILVDGKKLLTPSTGRTNDSFTFEQYYTSITASEVSTGVKISTMNFDIKPNGMATVAFGLMGKNVTRSTGAAYFTSPSAVPTTARLAGTRGTLYIGGTASSVVTGVTISMSGNMAVGEVVGASYTPDVFLGRVTGTGSFTAYFDSNTLFDNFVNETESSLVFMLTGATGEYLVINAPRIKLTSFTKNDVETGGIIATVNFDLLKYQGAGNYDNTTLVLQDTTL